MDFSLVVVLCVKKGHLLELGNDLNVGGTFSLVVMQIIHQLWDQLLVGREAAEFDITVKG